MNESYTPEGAESFRRPAPEATKGEGADLNQVRRERESVLFSSGWDRYMAPTEDNKGRAIAANTLRTYNTNNEVVTAVDSQGNQFVAPRNHDIVRGLESAGFKKDEGIMVPYSNEGPTHPDAVKRWGKLVADNERYKQENPQAGGN